MEFPSTLTADGKLEELANEMDKYRWNIRGISEIRWIGFGDTSADIGHKLYFSGKEDKHEHSVGFLVHNDIMDSLWSHGLSTSQADSHL